MCTGIECIESLVKLFKGSALTAKAPPIKFNPWPETDCPWLCLHIDFAGPYYLIVIEEFFQVARNVEMQGTNSGSGNWVSTRAVCAVRGSKFYYFG